MDEAGRERDALVAEKIMGWRRIEWEGGATPMGRSPHNVLSLVLEEVPHYSTDIAAAFKVVEHMRARGWRVSIDDTVSFRGIEKHHDWLVLFWMPGRSFMSRQSVSRYADILPEAICDAALTAIEVPA